jgi:hypothetical protein
VQFHTATTHFLVRGLASIEPIIITALNYHSTRSQCLSFLRLELSIKFPGCFPCILVITPWDRRSLVLHVGVAHTQVMLDTPHWPFMTQVQPGVGAWLELEY